MGRRRSSDLPSWPRPTPSTRRYRKQRRQKTSWARPQLCSRRSYAPKSTSLTSVRRRKWFASPESRHNKTTVQSNAAVAKKATSPTTGHPHTQATQGPAVGKRGRDGAKRRPPAQEPILLNQVSPAVPDTSRIPPATQFDSAILRAGEQNVHPRVGRLGKASGFYLHCRLDGHPCWLLVDTGATISLVRPETLLNTK